MTDSAQYQNALGKLREVLVGYKPGNAVYDEIVTSRDQVHARFQPIFVPANLDTLTAEQFKPFLYLENNRHWSGLYRLGGRACEDMPKLRSALKALLDESQPLDKRFTYAINSVQGMGKALATAILLVAYPDRYGVWNNTSESGLKELDIWPQFEWGESLGQRYVKVNQMSLQLAHDLNIDLWTLDAIWWSILSGGELPSGMDAAHEPDTERPTLIERKTVSDSLPLLPQRFALERHLQDFLLDNWPRTELGHEWAIYAEDGDDGAGYEYPTKVGRIDLLAKHKHEPRWLVVELKRDQTSDATVGQALRYIGWVKQNLAKRDDQVEGLIIAHEADESIKYAISVIPNVRLMLYEVEFRLTFAPEVGGK